MSYNIYMSCSGWHVHIILSGYCTAKMIKLSKENTIEKDQ